MDAFSLGQMLRQARQTRDISLERVEQELKIRRFILEGFEQGNFNAGDISQVQARGFLRNYARYLGLDEDLIIQYYESALVPDRRRRTRTEPRPQPKRSTQPMPITPNSRPDSYSTQPYGGNLSKARGRRLLNTALILIVAAGALLVIVFVAPRILSPAPENAAPPQATPLAEVSEGLPTFTPTPDGSLLPTSTPEITTSLVQNYSGEPVLVTVEFVQRTWLRVVADGQEVFRGVVRPQELIFEQRASNELTLEASNSKALVMIYNGQLQPTFETRGESVRMTFRPNRDVTVTRGGRSVAQIPDKVQSVTLEPTVDSSVVQPATPTPSATFAVGVPSPLPVFGQPTAAPTETPQAVVTVVTVEAASTTAATVDAAIASPTPTATATPSVPLPPRVTPTGQAPQKPTG